MQPRRGNTAAIDSLIAEGAVEDFVVFAEGHFEVVGISRSGINGEVRQGRLRTAKPGKFVALKCLAVNEDRTPEACGQQLLREARYGGMRRACATQRARME